MWVSVCNVTSCVIFGLLCGIGLVVWCVGFCVVCWLLYGLWAVAGMRALVWFEGYCKLLGLL